MEPLAPGNLIRYDAMPARWYLGVVRQVNGDTVEIEYFSQTTESVPRDRVTRFADYLDLRGRVFSLTRTAFCEAFFGEPLRRMREERFRTIETTLRKHGIEFCKRRSSSGRPP